MSRSGERKKRSLGTRIFYLLIGVGMIGVAATMVGAIAEEQKKEKEAAAPTEAAAPVEAVPNGGNAEEKQLFDDLVEAYIYAFPSVLMDQTEKEMTESLFFAPVNRMAYMTRLPSPGLKMSECPNVDSLLSTAWFNLSEEPQVVILPENASFDFFLELLDGWTNLIGTFDRGNAASLPAGEFDGRAVRSFVLTGPNSSTEIPASLRVIQSPTDRVWLINRVLLGPPRSEKDLNLVPVTRTLYEFETVPLSEFLADSADSKNPAASLTPEKPAEPQSEKTADAPAAPAEATEQKVEQTGEQTPESKPEAKPEPNSESAAETGADLTFTLALPEKSIKDRYRPNGEKIPSEAPLARPFPQTEPKPLPAEPKPLAAPAQKKTVYQWQRTGWRRGVGSYRQVALKIDDPAQAPQAETPAAETKPADVKPAVNADAPAAENPAETKPADEGKTRRAEEKLREDLRRGEERIKKDEERLRGDGRAFRERIRNDERTLKDDLKRDGERVERSVEKMKQDVTRGGRDIDDAMRRGMRRTRSLADGAIDSGRDAAEYFDRRFHRDVHYLAQEFAPLFGGERWKLAPLHQVERMSGAEFFGLLPELLTINPPSTDDAPMIEKLKKIGIVAGEPFDVEKAPPKFRHLVRFAVPYAQMKIAEAATAGLFRPEGKNGWITLEKLGDFGTNYLCRAVIAERFLGANRASEVLYPFTFQSIDGDRLCGRHDYLIHFEPGQTPPTDVLWSITLYGPDFGLVPNPARRYSVRSNQPLVRNGDGSLDILISSKEPAENISNWLPAPKDDFMLMMRIYQPKAEALDGRWSAPGVMKTERGDSEVKK